MRGWQVALEDGGREVERTFEVLYLDERLRVARFQPEDGREPQLFVFRRAADPEEEEEEEEEVRMPQHARVWRLRCCQQCMKSRYCCVSKPSQCTAVCQTESGCELCNGVEG